MLASSWNSLLCSKLKRGTWNNIKTIQQLNLQQIFGIIPAHIQTESNIESYNPMHEIMNV